MNPEATTVSSLIASLVALVGAAAVWLRSQGQKAQADSQKAQVEGQNERLAKIEVKVDTLFQIYITDAASDARRSGMLRSNSPLVPTEAWWKLLGPGLSSAIKQDLCDYRKRLPPDDTALEVWVKYRTQLLAAISVQDMKAAEALAILSAFAENRDGDDR